MFNIKIRVEAERCNLTEPNAEVACLIREKFSDKEIKEMGLEYIVTMHEPIKDADGILSLLGADRFVVGRGLRASNGGPDDGWDREDGFAFDASQVGP